MEHHKDTEYNNQQTERTVQKPRRHSGLLLVIGIVFLSLLAGGVGSFLYATFGKQEVTVLPQGYDGNNVVTKQEQNIADVAAKVSPSVVSILTKTQSGGFSPYTANEEDGAGTGIIISKDGYILTNNHVIDGASTVTVVDANGTTYDNVKVLGRDPLNDVAFLKINGVNNLKPAELGDSKTIRIGQSVVAIGNALGQYQNTVTSGIISGTGRSITASLDGSDSNSEDLSDLIQTDAAINPGNSGGPLVNMAGQVIGINTAIASDASNVGFVIPISSEKGVIDGVLKTGKISHAYIGVRYLPITPEVAKEYHLSVKEGAYIYGSDGHAAIVAGGPADKAGLKEKDIITKVNGVPAGSQGNVSTLIGEYKPGDTVELTVLRDGKTLQLKITLDSYNQR